MGKSLFESMKRVRIPYFNSTGSYQSTKVYDRPLLSNIGKKTMAYEGVARNPVIVVHGFLGSYLEDAKTGDNVWGVFDGIETLEGYSEKHLRDLSHPMQMHKPLHELINHIRPERLLGKVNLKFFKWKIPLNAYDKMLDVLTEAGYCREDKPLPKNKNFHSLFSFYYDWRRDLPENAARLDKFIQEKKACLQQQYEKLYQVKDYDVQFDIVSHSMGGLLSRYYLRYGAQDLPPDGSLPKLDWRGSLQIDKLIIVGTPNAGYLDTCLEMVSGLRLEPLLPAYHPILIGTFPSYYQMLPLTSTRSVVYADDPNGEPVDLFDPAVWEKLGWGLASQNSDAMLKILLPEVKTPAERRQTALEHLEKCLSRAKQFTEAMRICATPPDDVALFAFVGDAVETSRRATVNRDTGELKVVEYEAGDGKVLASSVRMDESAGESDNWQPFEQTPIKWQAVVHLKAGHMGITESYSFADNVSYYLLAYPTKKKMKREN